MTLAVVGLLFAACDVHSPTAPGRLVSITVTPNPTTLAVNGTQQLTAMGRDADGVAFPIAPTWAVVAGGGAINGAGLFTAGTVPGTFPNTVTASIGGISGTATIIVKPGPLATITVTPSPVTLVVNGTQQFVAVGKDSSGNIVPFVPTWSVVAGGGAIGAAGLFTAGGAVGTYTHTVQASNIGIKGFATVNVIAGALASITVAPDPATLVVNGKQQFVAVGTDLNGNSVPIAATWSVVAGGGAVDSTGLFTAGTVPGTFAKTVQASSGAFSGTATVTVTAGALASITVTPTPVTLAVNGAQRFVAVGRDANGNTVPIVATWSVVAGGGAVDGGGLFTAGVVTGTFTNTVQAASGALSASATVVVTAGPLASITVTPNPSALVVNGAQQFTAIGRDVNGNTVPITPTWSVVAGGGAISSAGLFTAGTVPGTFTKTVKATSGTLHGPGHLCQYGKGHERHAVRDHYRRRDGRTAGEHHAVTQHLGVGRQRRAAVHGHGQGRQRQHRADRAHLVGRGRRRRHQ
ncbi:MAG: hypothetical protein B7Z74_06315, partial [Deltaproteobacteria bacterium 21-66-5]